MRTHKNLFEKIISFQNLLKATKLAQRGKRFKPSTACFNFRMEEELLRLQQELTTKIYEPGQYHHFTVFEPKERIISAASYRDRVVHHAIHNILEPIFDPIFIFDSYATRKGKGTHAAINRFQAFAKICPYVLKCDVRQYFSSIDHEILKGLIRRKIACKDTLWLLDRIIDSHTSETSDHLPLFHRAVGIPIGNLTSQFFANIYLNGFDHYMKENLHCRFYVRYMDDFVIFHHDKGFLQYAKESIRGYLAGLHLFLHEEKCRIYKTEKGVAFLGMVIFPFHRRLKRSNVVKFKKRLRQLKELYKKRLIGLPKVRQSICSWIGYACHANTMTLRRLVLEDAVF